MPAESNAIDRVLSRLVGAQEAPAAPDRTVPTSLRGLDELLAGGLHTGQTTVVTGRRGAGASTFALGLARSAALHHSLNTVVLAPQSPEDEVVMRLISAETRVPLQHLRSGRLSENQFRRLSDQRDRLSSAPLAIRAGQPLAAPLTDVVDDLSAEVHDLRLVVVDDIEPFPVDRDVSAMATWARRERLALVLVTRSPADEVADAVDTVLSVERGDPPEAAVHVTKHRYGPTGSVRLLLDQGCCAFSDLPYG